MFHRSALEPDSDWCEFLDVLAGQAAIAIDSATMFRDLQRSHLELMEAYEATIEGWGRALDLRDQETEGHSRRVTDLAERLARTLGMSEADLVHVRRGSLLHDIGKMGVPDRILLKPDDLTADRVARHAHATRRTPTTCFPRLTFLRPALDIPYCHHEKWDGTGYPQRPEAANRSPSPRACSRLWMSGTPCAPTAPTAASWSEAQTLDHIRSLSGSTGRVLGVTSGDQDSARSLPGAAP